VQYIVYYFIVGLVSTLLLRTKNVVTPSL